MPMQAGTARGLVDIVSGSFGAGHDAAAREIAQELRSRGFVTRTWDIVDLLPGYFGRALRAGYLRQVQAVPSSWAWVLRMTQRHDAVVGFARWALDSSGPAIMGIAAARPVAIVSTHPFASQVLGDLRESGRLDVPVVTYLTDMSVHRLWVHPAVDVHLAVHEIPARQAQGWGAHLTQVVRPAVSPAFAAMRSVREGQPDRRTLDGSRDLPLALVTGGAFGIGELEQTARDIVETGLATPVVLCGRNNRLRRRIHPGGRAIALDWVDDMPKLFGSVDVVMQNAGGITSLESLATGVPVLTYRCLPGHGETNAAALDEAGLIPWVRNGADLSEALVQALSVPITGSLKRPPCMNGPDVASVLIDQFASRVT